MAETAALSGSLLTNLSDSFPLYGGGASSSRKVIVGPQTEFNPETNKNIVLFLDGTSNEFGTNPYTNVLRLFQMTLMDEKSQVCYYQPGIGARFEAESEDNVVTNMIDEAIATSLSRHVVAAYNYIVSQYKPGDRIYLFGFSRGSFTCRALAGMIERVGLLYRGLEHLTNQAWEYYSNWQKAQAQAQTDDMRTLFEVFGETFCRLNVNIYFMGIFDSVNSVGLLRDKMFPYVIRSSNVVHTRHAISLDERRAKFKELFIKDAESRLKEVEQGGSSSEVEESFKELMFSGNHGDVGGGWHTDTTVEGSVPSDHPWDKQLRYLSGVPMRWLLKEAQTMGVLFQPKDIDDFNSKQAIQYTLFGYWHDILSFNSSPQLKFIPKSSESLNTQDEIASKSKLFKLQENPPQKLTRFDGRGYGTLLKTLFWWILEVVPFAVKKDRASQAELTGLIRECNHHNRKFCLVFTPNFGKHRDINYTADYHWSVFYRIHFITNYTPGNIKYNNQVSLQDKWGLGTKFINLMKVKESAFSEDLWEEIEEFRDKLNNLPTNSPKDYILLIKNDRSEFWLYLIDDYA
ncbi:uncharacterized protein KQ657_004308 [Scheffersomyces spartinae]|uniref:T6SS Phospholipase effector Tle1-like catalytic domain-containing protein n=1 Tax=Scheffersomyces spartinae TaxID=45513 RepID=A0A9P7VB55_9ASCO|nr:uncharacterized protein KQ657_004308 [Scheffersomyces spartinae]KAG7194632.1 hypothetical protein KQ657_004308 [Scheffersomyces spartinae]